MTWPELFHEHPLLTAIVITLCVMSIVEGCTKMVVALTKAVAQAQERPKE